MRLKVLIADQRIPFAKEVAKHLSGHCEIKQCHDGSRTLEYCRKFKPDILFLDMEMPHLDGLSIIRAILDSGMKIEILACTVCVDSPYAMRQLVHLGVRYILPKPCTVAAAVARLYEMMVTHSDICWDVENEINCLMLSLGLRMDLNGYPCLREAIIQMLQDHSKQVTKSVYPEVAKKFGGDGKRIERVIRSVIEDAWKRRDENVWNMYFNQMKNGEIKCPTNGYFISRMVMCIENRKIG